MFTTGSKLFLGATTLAMVAAIVFGALRAGDTGWTATVGLITLTVVLACLTALNFFVRDSNVSAMQPDAVATAPAAQEPPTASMWPAIASVGLALLVIGLVTEPIVFKAGIVVLLAVLVEWMVQGWSDRASSDPAYNESLRQRMLHPLEFPLLATVGLGTLVFSFSRIMLFLSKSGGPVAFGVLAALVLFAGFLFASKQSLRRSVTIGVCALAALGIVSTGAAAAIDGPREIHEHETVGDRDDICDSNEETEVDEKGSQSVALKTSVTATVVYDGAQVYANVSGLHGPKSELTLPRSNPSNIIFENHGDDHVRLTAHLGTFAREGLEVDGRPVLQPDVVCTTLVEPGGKQLLTLSFSKSSAATTPDDPYRFVVPGVDSEIRIVVP